MQRKTKFCVQVHYVMESICINKHMFAQRNLQLTRIELWITKNSQKNGRKFRENWNKVLIVSDDVGWNFQSPGMTSKYGNLTKNTQKNQKKHQKKIKIVLRMSCTGFSIHSRSSACIYPKREISLGLTKTEEK